MTQSARLTEGCQKLYEQKTQGNFHKGAFLRSRQELRPRLRTRPGCSLIQMCDPNYNWNKFSLTQKNQTKKTKEEAEIFWSNVIPGCDDMYNVYHVAEKLWTTILFLKKKRQIRHALHLWKYLEWLLWELGQSLFTCEIWFPVSLLIYIQFHYRKKVLKYFPFFGGHNGDNARLDCPQLHQLGMFKIQIMPLVKMFKTQYVPKSFVYKLCRNIYDSKCVKMFKLGKQTNLGLPDPTNSFYSLP